MGVKDTVIVTECDDVSLQNAALAINDDDKLDAVCIYAKDVLWNGHQTVVVDDTLSVDDESIYFANSSNWIYYLYHSDTQWILVNDTINDEMTNMMATCDSEVLTDCTANKWTLFGDDGIIFAPNMMVDGGLCVLKNANEETMNNGMSTSIVVVIVVLSSLLVMCIGICLILIAKGKANKKSSDPEPVYKLENIWESYNGQGTQGQTELQTMNNYQE